VKLVYVGRFENTQKRISDVVKIIKKLDETGIDFTFDMVGDGEEMPAVRSELATQIDSGRVRVHGWVDSAEVIEIMRSSEVFILASAYEGFCISLTEAMANGCTPIVSDIRSGNKQLVADGVSGFTVPVGDVDGFVDRIRLLAGDRGRLREMRVAAWRTGREYGVDRMVDNYVACFERAIEDTRSNPRTVDPAFPLMESCRSKYPLWLRRIKARVSSF
jgi:glycosyltransferase involved in cell wall biosynthesis